MKIFMTGGTGFVGTFLADRLIREGHQVTILTQAITGREAKKNNLSYLNGDPNSRGKWQEAVRDHDVIINLAGASIFSRWTQQQKIILRASRINTTKHLVEALPDNASHITFFSTSAVGYYGFHKDEELIESSPAGNDFLARLAHDWEAEAFRAQEKNARVVITRFGIVLGPDGGALGQMIPLFKFFLGGPLGSGRQWFSWIHIQDLTEAIVFLLKHKEVSGTFNLCSPRPVRNGDLGRPSAKYCTVHPFCPHQAL